MKNQSDFGGWLESSNGEKVSLGEKCIIGRAKDCQVVGALEGFKKLQGLANAPFRLVLHYGAATSGGAPTMGEESLTGREVNFAFRMEDLASTVGTSVLLSESAVAKIGPALNVSSYGRHGLTGFNGNFEFFSL